MHGLNKLRSEFKPYISSPLLHRQCKGGNLFRFAFYNDFHPFHPPSCPLVFCMHTCVFIPLVFCCPLSLEGFLFSVGAAVF